MRINTQHKSIFNELSRAYFFLYTYHKNVAQHSRKATSSHRSGEKIRVKTHHNFYVSIQLLFYKAVTIFLCWQCYFRLPLVSISICSSLALSYAKAQCTMHIRHLLSVQTLLWVLIRQERNICVNVHRISLIVRQAAFFFTKIMFSSFFAGR